VHRLEEVVGIDGRTIGTLADVFATPAHGILEIEKADGATLLVPAIEEVIADIEWDRARVVVNDLTPYGVEDAH
jgi:ribosomal 30S subunit maturation factor RimM